MSLAPGRGPAGACPRKHAWQVASPGLGFRCVGEGVPEVHWTAKKFVGLPRPDITHRCKEEAPCRVQAGGDAEGAGIPGVTRGVCSVHTGKAVGRGY